ncbi:fumarylacetoacetate hydrolase family protein [Sphingomonas corticis]|uniref:Fumarylacetoacetate hydrolase family protein n=1 Tax=Sphingomonas corticis TaxID=2722791 RepID=A0ABX1CUX3_9SPHN|nr:fumarylacetoacetate hydrolase family protein [Sphingomonas corticis]NJR80606.1 fumarylacetoacetate hydrolase family protein [Sphingomonas corticis]
MTGGERRWAVPPPEQPVVPVADGTLFPVRRIWCVGRNYPEHAREMGSDPTREPPFFFGKPADTVVGDGSSLPFPTCTADLHHEVELAVAIGRAGADLSSEAAGDAILGYAVAIDLTRRDLQAQAKKTGRPWEMGKAFDRSCPIGTIRPITEIGHPKGGAITLHVDGELRQLGDMADMIWSPAECVAELSRFVELAPGDLVLTGTPAGVGPVRRGQTMRAECGGVGSLTVSLKV